MDRAHIAIVMSVALVSCAHLMPGDGAFGVTGTLSSSAGECELLLRDERGVEIPVSRRKIQGPFRIDYTVAPYAKEYQVAVACSNRSRNVATIKYGTDVKPGQWVSLGDIAI